MTKLSKVLYLLALPLLAIAQSSAQNSQSRPSGSQQPSQTVLTITSATTFITFGPNRQEITTSSVQTIITTSTIQPPSPTPSGNGTSNSVSASGNATSSTSTKPLPTAPTNISGGGGANGAPLPGATGGAYGPDDNYIAAAQGLKRNAFAVGFGGILVGGAMMLL